MIYRGAMRRVAAMALIPVVGCFQELPAPPGDASAGASSGSTGGGSTGGGSSGASTGGGAEATSDDDAPTGTTAAAEPPQGLFACQREAPCAPWDCSGGCNVAGPIGTCVLTALRDRAAGALEITVSAEHRLLVRGGGADEVTWQWRMGAPATYSEPRRCALKTAEFFDGCLKAFAPDCADPSNWAVDCAAVDSTCP